MKPGIICLLIALFIASSRSAVAQRFEHLPLEVQAEVKEIQLQLLLTQKLYQRLELESKRVNPLISVAQRHYRSPGVNDDRAAARRAVQEDVQAYVKAGRGREELFKHWQLHYAMASNDKCLAALLADEQLRPIILDVLRPLASWSCQEDLFKLTDEELIARVEEYGAASAASSRFLVSTIEPEVAPTELERQHVHKEVRHSSIETMCHYYLDLRDPKQLENLRVQIRYSQDRLSKLWPAGSVDTRDPQLQAIAFKLMRELRQW